MDKEEKKLWQQEINWRDKTIKEQSDVIFHLRHKEAIKNKPIPWTVIGFIVFAFVIFSLLPG
tara:strand:- start:49 stop:234 length:186 start_codon:yes stop_codon:yes gene_type:complete